MEAIIWVKDKEKVSVRTQQFYNVGVLCRFTHTIVRRPSSFYLSRNVCTPPNVATEEIELVEKRFSLFLLGPIEEDNIRRRHYTGSLQESCCCIESHSSPDFICFSCCCGLKIPVQMSEWFHQHLFNAIGRRVLIWWIRYVVCLYIRKIPFAKAAGRIQLKKGFSLSVAANKQ